MHWMELATIRSDRRFSSSNGGWNLDAYPDTPTLDAGATITIAEIEGPAAITYFHCTNNGSNPGGILSPEELQVYSSRGVVLEIFYDGAPTPAVRVPLGDFFCDGCRGQARYFTTPFVEKSPRAYNCFIPMPFAKSARVALRNETELNLMNYSFVEWETLPAWDSSLGYFHATWDRFAFRLDRSVDRPFFHVDGAGHLVGRNWSIATDEPLFRDFAFVMEGNNEVRVDGDPDVVADYLGSEDSFGFAWGWPETFHGVHNGVNYLRGQYPALLSTYRFRRHNVLRFRKSLDWRIDWTHEFPGHPTYHADLARRWAAGGGWVDYSTTYYWFQDGVGYDHAPLLPVGERMKELLHPNPLLMPGSAGGTG